MPPRVLNQSLGAVQLDIVLMRLGDFHLFVADGSCGSPRAAIQYYNEELDQHMPKTPVAVSQVRLQRRRVLTTEDSFSKGHCCELLRACRFTRRAAGATALPFHRASCGSHRAALPLSRTDGFFVCADSEGTA